jgi:hypothetical protein
MRILGQGDEEKRVCWTPEFEQDDCVVFSLGSNNQWTFEENVVKETKCKIHTFDCTVFDPRPPAAGEKIDFFFIFFFIFLKSS